MTPRTAPAVIYAAGKLHTDRCSQTEPTGVPYAAAGAWAVAEAKRCRSCNPSSRLVARLIAEAREHVAAVEAAPQPKPTDLDWSDVVADGERMRDEIADESRPRGHRVAGTSHARTVIVPSMLEPLRDAQTAAPVPDVTETPADAPDVSPAGLTRDERGFLNVGEKTCDVCGETKPITTFPTSTSRGQRVRLGYCRACRTKRATS